MKNEFALPVMESYYNLRNFHEFVTDRKSTIWYGPETLSYRYPQLFFLFPETLIEINTLSQFKTNIR